MPESKAKKIADKADMIVGGFAMLRNKKNVRIVNLNSGHVSLVSPDFDVIATDMDDIESALAVSRLKDNYEFMSA